MTLPSAIQAHLGGPQADTARRLGLKKQAWSRYLAADGPSPTVETAEDWLRALSLSASWDAARGWTVRAD